MKLNKLFRREQNINFWGVPKFRLYRTGGGGASGKDPGPQLRLN